MQFKDLKPGYSVHILDKTDGLKYTQGKAVNVTAIPYLQNNIGAASQLVVDVTVEVDGKTSTYTIPESLETTYTGNLVLSTGKEGILREVEAMKHTSEEALNQVEKHKSIVENASDLMEKLNPAFAEKREAEKRISGIETEVKGLKDMLKNFIEKMGG